MNIFDNFWVTFVNVIKSFGFNDALDVILVTFILYKVLQFARETRATQFVKAILVIVAVWVASYYLHLTMMLNIMNAFFQFGIIAIIVLFQPELRNLLEKLGRSKFMGFFSNNLFSRNSNEGQQLMRRCITLVCESCAEMSETKTGALIVFERNTPLNEAIASGTIVDATPSSEMIDNIFFNKAPLHDGAMIIRDARIYAAGCILPLTKRVDVSTALGTRHRSALGMSENSDAVVVVVSEETGQISIAEGGILTRDFTRETLYDRLANYLITDSNSKPERKLSLKSFRKEGKKK